MRLAALLLGVAAVAAAPASACRGESGERFVLLETPPRKLPAGAVLLQVRVPPKALYDGKGYAHSATGRITGARDKKLIGKRIEIRPTSFSSCDHWSASERADQVVGFLTRSGHSLALVPVVYRSKQYRTPAEDRSEGITRPPGLEHE